ncbi:MAG: ESPR domain-containing protein, partial [Proteobacteria bacterium]|nr:ESPR domain-containing protein [Pseudomonadota bacterium]
MNKTYRSVFCRKTGTCVAVSEIAGATRGRSGVRVGAVALAAAALCSGLGWREADAASFYWQGGDNRSDSGAGNYGSSSNLSMSISGDNNDNCGTVAVDGRTNIAGSIGTSVAGVPTLTPVQLYNSILGNVSGSGINRENNTVW